MTPTPQAQEFGAFLDAAMVGHPAIHLPPYHRPAPIVVTPMQTEAQVRANGRIWDYDESHP
jgi:hypothetical protein